jgi:uncharacterized membrane protein YphA (DoxX/SURF4 family)
MLSLFPEVFYLEQYGITLLRVVAGLVLAWHAINHLRHANLGGRTSGLLLALFELLIAALLIVGLFTQAAAIFLAALAIGSLILNYRHGSNHYSKSYYFLLAAIGLALLVLGPGHLAFDLPL